MHIKRDEEVATLRGSLGLGHAFALDSLGVAGPITYVVVHACVNYGAAIPFLSTPCLPYDLADVHVQCTVIKCREMDLGSGECFAQRQLLGHEQLRSMAMKRRVGNLLHDKHHVGYGCGRVMECRFKREKERLQ